MRIQEMRSGLAYLNKRRPTRRFQGATQSLESTQLRLSGPSAPQKRDAPADINEERVKQPASQELSELDKPQWSVASFSGLIAGGLTYAQATKMMEVLGDDNVPGLCVITDVAALPLLGYK